MKIEADDELVWQVFEMMDSNNDKEISLKELYNFMRKTRSMKLEK